MTPKHHTRFLNSGYSQLPKHGPAEGGPFVELDATDAASRGLTEGDRARVWNDRASVELPVRITERLRPGLAAIPFGWWAPAAPRRASGQRPHERHAHGLGRRRGVQRHARRDRRGHRVLRAEHALTLRKTRQG